MLIATIGETRQVHNGCQVTKFAIASNKQYYDRQETQKM